MEVKDADKVFSELTDTKLEMYYFQMYFDIFK